MPLPRPAWPAVLVALAGVSCMFDASGLPPGPTDLSRTDGSRIDRPGPTDGVVPELSGPVDIEPRPETQPPDTGPPPPPPPDTGPPPPPPPDTGPPPPDGPPYYVWEEFVSSPGAVQPKSGTWLIQSGGLRQTSTSANGYYALAAVPAADYIAETEVSIQSIANIASVTESAALSVRVQSQGAPPGQYGCRISPDQQSFGILECSGTSALCSLHTSTPVSVAFNTHYTIRAIVNGNQITCELPQQGKSLTITDSSFPGGGVALSTFYASATFYYLKVWSP